MNDGRFKKGKHYSKKTEFKKGMIPWNKGLKGIHLSPKSEFKKGMDSWNSGLKGLGICITPINCIKKGEHRGLNTEFKVGQNLNENNPKWKGENVGYFGLHTWIQRKYGKADICENKKCKKISNRYEWANLTGKYLRKRSDWKKLCKSCHVIMDNSRRNK